MKVKFNRAALQEALGFVMGVVPSRTPKPILQCVRITTQKETVRLCATDLEIGITAVLSQVEVAVEGDIVVPADKLASIVRESVDEIIALEAAEATVHLVGSDSRFTIYSHEPEQFPAVPGFDGKPDLQIKLDKLQEGIGRTVFAAAKESSRYALNGILWELDDKKLALVATDGRRLSKATIPLEKAAKLPEGRVIVPAKMMTTLEKMPVHGSEPANVKFVNNQIVVSSADIVVASNLVEGNFPKYEDIIPKDYEKKVVLPTQPTLSAVKRAALLATEDSKGVKLSLNKHTLVFSSRAPETGDAQVDMTVEYDHPAIEIGFNPQFLLDVLRVLNTQDFELHLGVSDRPGLIKSGTDFLYIIMPVNL